MKQFIDYMKSMNKTDRSMFFAIIFIAIIMLIILFINVFMLKDYYSDNEKLTEVRQSIITRIDELEDATQQQQDAIDNINNNVIN